MAATPARQPLVPPERDDRIDHLVAMLDQQRVGDGPTSWVVRVLGVHTEGGDIWIQVGRDDNPSVSMVLHLPPWATAHHAMAALATSQHERRSYPQIVDVMQST